MSFYRFCKIILCLLIVSLISTGARAEYFAELSYKLWNGDCPKDLKNPSPGIDPKSVTICSGNSEAERLNLLRTSYGKVAESAFLGSLAQSRSHQLRCTHIQISHLQIEAKDEEKFIEDFSAQLKLLGYAKRRMLEIQKSVPFGQTEREEYEKFHKGAEILLATLPYGKISAFRKVIDYVVSQHERFSPDRTEGWLEKQTKEMLKKAIPEALTEIEKNRAVMEKGVASIGLSLNGDEKESLAQDTDLVESFRNEHPDLQNELKPIACRVDSKYGRGAESRDLTLMGLSMFAPLAAGTITKIGSMGLTSSITGAAAIGSISLKTAQVLRILLEAGGTAASISQLTKTCLGNTASIKSKASDKNKSCEKNILESEGPGKCLLLGALSVVGFRVTAKSAKQALSRIANEADVTARQLSSRELPIAKFELGGEIRSNPQLAIWRLAESGHEAEAIKITKEIEASLQKSNIVQSEKIAWSASQPQVVTLENGLVGIWKSADAHLSNADAEIAAYKIDQMLRLNLVPITVEREIDGVKGSIQLFVSGKDDVQLAAKPQSLKFFDTFIHNTDRSSNNYQTFAGRPVGFDHSLSFDENLTMGPKFFDDIKHVLAPVEKQIAIVRSLERDLQTAERRVGKDSQAFQNILKRLKPQIEKERQNETTMRLIAKNELSVLLPDASVYERFKSISEQDWTQALKTQLSESQLSSLLARRTKMIEEIEKTKNTLGGKIFRDGPLSPLERPKPLSQEELAIRQLLNQLLIKPDSDATVSAKNIPVGSAHELKGNQIDEWFNALGGDKP